MNIENIKSQFPIFSQKINGKPLVYLDSSNSSQKPISVINRLNDFYKNEFSNIGRSIHSLAVNATNKFEETRMSVKNFINAKSIDEIIFTKNATESMNLVATTFGQQNIVKGDEILVTELEHHSNYVPWHFLRERKGAIIKFAPINEDGDIITDELKKLITSKTKIVAVTHLSNVTGTIVPIKEIVEIAHKKNVPVLVDGCQAIPHIKVDVTDLNCDFYAFSGHKVYGPTGVGVLYAKKKWLEKLPPYIGGGAMISEVKKGKIVYASPPEKYESGTMSTAEVIAFKESIKFMESIGMDNLIKHEDKIKNYALEKLRKINSVKIIGNPKNKAGVIAFTIQGIHPHDIATILDDDGVAIRAGHHCCQILHEKLNLTATARASIGVYNNKDDIDMLCKAIDNCKKIFD
ncbi:MAG: cysteine desulfurase [Candidatus Pelagibacter sp.]|jgi:cysteine desulfurase/selenocysteine lyase|nr:cysteine desulfurase [Candidatus Pelagibacter sp.]|tara:strand:+ start:35612 stop:36826 length:1215 start_codon:yes stop_codon:yes gene_type:complete